MREDDERTTCAVCGERAPESCYSLDVHKIVRCARCSHEYVEPIKPSTVRSYSFAANEAESVNSDIDMAYLWGVVERYDLLGVPLLDVGCGNGRLVTRLLRGGWPASQLYAVDASAVHIRNTANALPEGHAWQADVQVSLGTGRKFDAMILVEVLEDLPDPRRAMRCCLEGLNVGGVMVIRALPNNESVEAFLGAGRWRMRGFDTHYNFFNPRTFKMFLEQFPGLQILEWNCFLQPGYRFFNLRRLARNLGLGGADASGEDDASRLLACIATADFSEYLHRDDHLVAAVMRARTGSDLEAAFDALSLDYRLSPDFGVVLRKTA